MPLIPTPDPTPDAPDDGGPAFPMPSGPENVYEHGMTLRDYFAAEALTGLIASAEGEPPPSDYARASYAIADAMIAARRRRP